MTAWILGAALFCNPVQGGTQIDTASMVFRYIGSILYYAGLVHWHAKRLWKFVRPWVIKSTVSPLGTSATDAPPEKALDSSFFPNAYITTVSVGMVIILIITNLNVSDEYHTPISLCIVNIAYLSLQLGILVFYLRKVKYDELFQLRSLVDSKKTYLRFVAHELRTPLNSASLGVNWLISTLNEVDDKDEFDQELSGATFLLCRCVTCYYLLSS
jgi:signal transduction histidine kinase